MSGAVYAVLIVVGDGPAVAERCAASSRSRFVWMLAARRS